jgi:hypothetical protein
VSQNFQSQFEQRSSPDAQILSSIVYRSRAVTPPSDYELYELVQAAQSRNAAEAVTGLLLYDESRFYQWLEGPPENVARIMRAITHDPRHTDIEILSDKTTATRQFTDWTMRLATRGVRSIHSIHNVVVPSEKALDDIRNRNNVKLVLAGFSNAAMLPAPAPTNGPLRGQAGALLKNVIVSTVLPELLARHTDNPRSGPWPIDSRARALADLLIGPDNGAALELLRSLRDQDGSIRHLYETLVEPAARALGDLWTSDQCSEFDVTLGLAQLQRALRILNEDSLPNAHGGLILPAVLVVPEPGEIHAINSILDSDALWNAGWNPLSEFPVSDEALQDMMADSWFDALDLSLSASFRREHWLPKVTRTIALARHASQNPELVVIVAGRIFTEDNQAGTQVGADGVSTSAIHAEKAIRDGLHRHGTTPKTRD